MVPFRMALATLALTSLLLTGCSTSKTTHVPGGKVTTTENGDNSTATFEDNQGNKVETTHTDEGSESTYTDAEGNTTTFSTSSTGDFKETGLDPYPNTIADKATFNKASDGGNTAITATVMTKDSGDKVAKHFKDQLDKVENELKHEKLQSIAGTKGDKQIAITITETDEGTQVHVTSYTEEKS